MKKSILKLCCCVVAISLSPIQADGLKHEDILTIETPKVTVTDLHFPETEDIQPDESDFKIASIILLSNKSGERLSTVTFENLSNGQRILSKEHILAILANGQKKHPFNVKQKFSGRQRISLTLNFGVSKFPILTVYTKN